jgi:hypothetical protein
MMTLLMSNIVRLELGADWRLNASFSEAELAEWLSLGGRPTDFRLVAFPDRPSRLVARPRRFFRLSVSSEFQHIHHVSLSKIQHEKSNTLKFSETNTPVICTLCRIKASPALGTSRWKKEKRKTEEKLEVNNHWRSEGPGNDLGRSRTECRGPVGVAPLCCPMCYRHAEELRLRD